MKNTKRSLLHSGIALLLCISMFIGSTFAWFTDSISSGKNIITAGNLDLEMYWTTDPESGEWHNVESNGYNTVFSYDNWEPGYTEVKYIKLVNAGDLALNYNLSITPQDGIGKLAEVINVYFAEGNVAVEQRSDLSKLRAIGLLHNVLDGGATADGTLLAADQYSPLHPSGEVIVTMAMSMLTTAGNEYQNEDAGKFSITALATQAPFEEDSFGSDYDADAKFPTILKGDSASAPVSPVNGKVPAGGVTLSGKGVSAFVPEGVSLKAGANKLTLTVTPLEKSTSDIIAVNNEVLIPVDVHIDGVAENNNVPIIIDLGEVLPKYLNMGNYRLFHVENGVNNPMTLVADASALTAHNTFTYDPMTGEVSVAMASFSEVAMVADEANGWNGAFDDSWYDEDAEELTIINADQFVTLGAIVGGMKFEINKVEKQFDADSFKGQTIKLLSDINLADNYDANNPNIILYPVGYYNSEGTYKKTNTAAITSGIRNFEGTFDGNGHTIFNIYQNTWEMKGDHDWYDPIKEQYYRDGMGIFGRVYGGTIKNLTVDNFESDGEITTTGVIASYADGATFENIAITNCNPRVYNIGNGGIVGCVGWYAKEAGLKTTFKNITVDNSNKISALWGSYDVPCGGIVGQYYPTSGQTSAGTTPKNAGIHFENCHAAAQMDVNNDVCGNYQYYAYRYAGMLIGSVRENETIDGHVYPKMDGITAEDCTVHFGTWNDYYYCEYEKNGHPSYSGPDDYKFSRVPHSELEFTDSNGNGEIDTDEERASVEGCKHTHTAAEDNQAIYLPFNNLVTGYGWGVTTKVVGEMEGVTILDRVEANSVVKFEKADTAKDSYASCETVTIGELFKAKAIEDKKLAIKGDKVQVTVSPVGDGSTAGGTYTANTTDWTQGTLAFTGTGKAEIIITDYYFCKETKINVTITERQKEEKFDVVMNNGDFLHRVGNKGTVALDKLFKAKDGVSVGTVSVTVEAVNGTGASGTYSNNAIQFSGTGVVKVTITDNDYCTPTELYLEVVDATNVTSATGTTTGGNFVLLCDVSTSNYVNYWNSYVYGNGFTYSLKDAPTAYNSKQGKGIIITKNTTLDNLVIVGDVYTGYGAYSNQNYYNTVVDVTGDTEIRNCYISGCAAPIRARNNVTVINSTLYGGAVANLIIESGTVTLEDVTTANYDDGRSVVGLGIVVHADATDAAKLVINGKLTQYNFINESKVPADTNAKSLYTVMFGDSCSKYHFGTKPNRYVNTGIVSMTNTFNGEDITDNAETGYEGGGVQVSGKDGYVYTQLKTSGSVNNNYPTYKPTTQGAVPPSYSFDYTNKNYVAKTEGSNDYCYEENGKVNISMDQGDTFNWDTSILTIGKGVTSYTVSMNGTDYTGKSVAFNTAGDYTVTYTYTDGNNYKFDENGDITAYSVTYTKTVNITVAVVKATTKHAEFTFGSSNTASKTVTVGNSTYVMPNVSNTSNNIGSTTVDGKTIYYPIVEIVMSDGKTEHSSGWYAYFPVFSGAVTITDYANNGTGDKMTPYNGSTTTMPSGLSVVGDPKTLFKYQSGSNAGETPVVKNNILVYSSAKIEANRDNYNTVIQYSYTDNAGATYYYYIGYHAPKQTYSNCITPDTLITLADGSQKRVDSLTGNEMLLVWNLETGKYEAAPIVFVDSEEEMEYEVVKLYFSDGSEVKVISEHGFFDINLGKYVYIDAENYSNYIGHKFVSEGDISKDTWNVVTLDKVVVEKEVTTAWSPVTYKHLCYYTNGVLSMPGGIDGLFNIFEVDVDAMRYDEEKMQKDIEDYGLFTIEDFGGMIPEIAFQAFNGDYLKVAIGKGMLTWEDIAALAERYIPLM